MKSLDNKMKNKIIYLNAIISKITFDINSLTTPFQRQTVSY